jgi:hypothetical protein
MATTRLLTKAEYLETTIEPVVDISGREDAVQPDGVIDVEPYLAAIPAGDYGALTLVPDVPPAAVYRTGNGRFDHVLYALNRSNVYLVIIVELDPDRVLGHYILDLSAEYGIAPPTGRR